MLCPGDQGGSASGSTDAVEKNRISLRERSLAGSECEIFCIFDFLKRPVHNNRCCQRCQRCVLLAAQCDLEIC